MIPHLALETELLLQLSLSIGHGDGLHAMVQGVLAAMLRTLNASAAFVLQTVEPDGTVLAAPRRAGMLPRRLDEHPARRQLALAYSDRDLATACADRPLHEPIIVSAGRGVAMAWRLDGFGVLVLFRGSPLTREMLHALPPVLAQFTSTARRFASEALLLQRAARLQDAAASAGVGVWELDVAGRRMFWDETMCALMQVPPDAGDGHPDALLRMVHPDDAARVCAHYEAALASAPDLALEFRVRLPAAERARHVFASAVIRRTPDGAPSHMRGIAFDITERRAAEQAAREAREAADVANETKSRFLANVSHELRTPLNGMLGMTELALETSLSNQQREYLEIARTSAGDLLRLLNDLLDFAKIDAGALQLEQLPFSIADLVAETLKPIAARAERKQLAFALSLATNLPPSSLGDPGRVRQVLLNLCDNAIKFTETGAITVHVTAEPAADGTHDRIRCVVRDTGTGIPASQHEAIFDAFRQLDAGVRRRSGGTGLGLGIARQLAQAMGGGISLDSAPERGSAFCIELLMPRDPGVPSPVPWATDGRCAPRVLVASGNATWRTETSAWLQHWGCSSTPVVSARALVAQLRDARAEGRPFDTVILIPDLPDQPAASLPDLIQPVLATTRLILVTSAANRLDVANAETALAYRTLTMPTGPGELLTAIAAGHAERPAPSAPRPAAGHQATAVGRCRILLVEDDPINQLVATHMLARLGHEVTPVGNGREAVERCAGERFDLILMDVQLPELDGLAATRAIRASEASEQRTPIIAMTAGLTEHEQTAATLAGMDGVLAKPVRLVTLRETLAECLGSANGERSRQPVG